MHVVTRCKASDLSMSQGDILLGYRGMEEEGNRFLGWIVKRGTSGGGGREHPRRERKKKDKCQEWRLEGRKEGVRLVGRIRAVRIEGREVQQHTEGKIGKVILTC